MSNPPSKACMFHAGHVMDNARSDARSMCQLPLPRACNDREISGRSMARLLQAFRTFQLTDELSRRSITVMDMPRLTAAASSSNDPGHD